MRCAVAGNLRESKKLSDHIIVSHIRKLSVKYHVHYKFKCVLGHSGVNLRLTRYDN